MLKKSTLKVKAKSTFKKHISNKPVTYSIALTVLVLFGDTLIPALLHFLYILLEIINTIIEHFLEEHFHFNPRQAEMTVFWGGMTVNFIVLSYVLCKAYLKAKVLRKEIRMQWRSMQARPQTALYIKIATIMMSLMGLSFFLLT